MLTLTKYNINYNKDNKTEKQRLNLKTTSKPLAMEKTFLNKRLKIIYTGNIYERQITSSNMKSPIFLCNNKQ